jgi:hypothetical protein
MKRHAIASMVCVLALTSSAFADDEQPVGDSGAPPAGPAVVEQPTTPPPKPTSMTLKQGAVFVQVNAEMSMSKDKVLEPLSLAPDISYGVNDDLTVSLIHSTAAFTGFRGGSGLGLCVTGTDGGCANVYNNVGAEGLYSLLKGNFAVAAKAGVLTEFVDVAMESKTFLQAKVGANTRYTMGNVFVQFNPAVWIPLNETDANKPQIWLPVALWVKVMPPLSLFAASGLKGATSNAMDAGFGDLYTINLGGGAQYTINKAVAVGGSFIFGTMFGAPDTTGPDSRAVHLWLNYSM